MERFAFNDKYPGAQLGLTILFSFIGFLFFGLLSYVLSFLVFGVHLSDMVNIADFTNPRNVEIAKFMQLVVSAGLFIVVPLILARIFSGHSFMYLKVNNVPSPQKLFWVILIILAAMPVVNLLGTLNSHLRFPGFMSSVEKYLMAKEKENDGLTEMFLTVHSFRGFAMNLLVIAIIPAFGEEFFFRGVIQRIFTKITQNTHWGIIISGFIFSAFHMQFYGFLPRWLLGIMFGYMLVWSGSLWLPILAHFLNNGVAVFIFYLADTHVITSKILDYGSEPNGFALFVTMITTLLMTFGLYRLYKISQPFPES